MIHNKQSQIVSVLKVEELGMLRSISVYKNACIVSTNLSTTSGGLSVRVRKITQVDRHGFVLVSNGLEINFETMLTLKTE